MAEWLSLHDLAVRAVDGGRPVARGPAGRTVTHAHFLAEVGRSGAAGCTGAGPRVGLYTDDTLTFLAALFGAWHAGKAVSLPGDLQPATLARLLPLVGAVAGELPGALTPPAVAPALAAQPLDPRATRLSVHTSGSSGDPVAIDKSLAQLDAELHTLEAAFGAWVDADRSAGGAPVEVVATVSHQHIYGLLFHALWPLAAGRLIVPRRLQYPEEIAAGLHAPTVLVTSPAHLRRLPDTVDWSAARPQLRAVFSSGGPLPPEAAASALALLGRSPTEVYGSSETGGIAWRRRAEHGDRWTALPGIQWRDGPDGRLAVRSPHLPEPAWYETADVVVRDGDGFVLRGRADRIVKIEEKRVSLDAMERALLAGGELAEVRVVELPEGAGPRLGVVGVPAPAGRALLSRGKRVLNDRLRARLLDVVERVALPRRFRYLDHLPANAQGKTPLGALQALFCAERPVPRLLDRGTDRVALELELDPSLRVFDGHFPGVGLLPGVAQVDWAIAFGRESFPLPPLFRRLDVLKFQRPLRPGMVVQLVLTWRAAAGALGFTYTSPQGVHASGSVVFEGHDAV